MRPLLSVSLWSLLAGVLLALPAARAEAPLGLAWIGAHAGVLLAGFLYPALFAFHLHVLGTRTGKHPDPKRVARSALLAALAALFVAGGRLLPGTGYVEALGWLLLTGAGVLQVVSLKSIGPDGSLVDTAADPLTKGDDASYKHLLFAHRMLLPGLLLLAAAALPLPGASRLELAGGHLALVGFALLSVYGLGHLLIPRFSTVPAIAAGAIKGELHSSLLGIVLLTAGFLADHESSVGQGLLIAGGSFVFLGMFVYMGVLGANIMKNKSRTQRVTPEFVYIPWTFAGVFWLISGILMGLFLNAVPDVLADRQAGLRFFHIHSALFGGIAMLLLGWAHRSLPADQDAPPPHFARSRAPFLWMQIAFGTALIASLTGAFDVLTAAAAVLALTLGIVIYRLRPYPRT